MSDTKTKRQIHKRDEPRIYIYPPSLFHRQVTNNDRRGKWCIWKSPVPRNKIYGCIDLVLYVLVIHKKLTIYCSFSFSFFLYVTPLFPSLRDSGVSSLSIKRTKYSELNSSEGVEVCESECMTVLPLSFPGFDPHVITRRSWWWWLERRLIDFRLIPLTRHLSTIQFSLIWLLGRRME